MSPAGLPPSMAGPAGLLQPLYRGCGGSLPNVNQMAGYPMAPAQTPYQARGCGPPPQRPTGRSMSSRGRYLRGGGGGIVTKQRFLVVGAGMIVRAVV